MYTHIVCKHWKNLIYETTIFHKVFCLLRYFIRLLKSLEGYIWCYIGQVSILLFEFSNLRNLIRRHYYVLRYLCNGVTWSKVLLKKSTVMKQTEYTVLKACFAFFFCFCFQILCGNRKSPQKKLIKVDFCKNPQKLKSIIYSLQDVVV